MDLETVLKGNGNGEVYACDISEWLGVSSRVAWEIKPKLEELIRRMNENKSDSKLG